MSDDFLFADDDEDELVEEELQDAGSWKIF